MVLALDETDRGILHALQTNARGSTAAEIAAQVDVSASTVRNRIGNLESSGVIQGYHPDIDYEEAGFQLHVFLMCRAPAGDRARIAREARELSGVVCIREILTGHPNLHIEAVGVDTDAIDDLTAKVGDLGLEIVNSHVIKNTYFQPFDDFGAAVVDG